MFICLLKYRGFQTIVNNTIPVRTQIQRFSLFHHKLFNFDFSLFGSGKSCRFRYHFIETDPLFTIFLRYFESDGFLLRISSYYSPKVRLKQRDADYFIIGHYRSQTQFFSGNVNASTSQYICREPSYRSCHISNVTGIPQVLSPCPAFTQMY